MFFISFHEVFSTMNPSNSADHLVLMDLIFENKLREMMQLVPNLSTLNFISVPTSSPLTLAVGTAEEEVIEYLLLRGADPNFADAQTLPLIAAIERSVEADKYWADNGLEEGGRENPMAIIELLLLYGADFTKKDPSGESAYEFAIKVHHPSTRLFESLMQEPKGD